LTPGPILTRDHKQIIDRAAKYRLPAIYEVARASRGGWAPLGRDRPRLGSPTPRRRAGRPSLVWLRTSRRPRRAPTSKVSRSPSSR
jgi:hypothetical protein